MKFFMIYLTQGFSIRRHIGQDDQNVFLALISQKLGSGQGETWGNNSLDGGIVGQVQEQAHVLHRAVLFEILLEEPGGLHVDTHSCEYDGEVVFVIVQYRFSREFDKTSLPTNLGSDFVVR